MAGFCFLHTLCSVKEIEQLVKQLGLKTATIFGSTQPNDGCVVSFTDSREQQQLFLAVRSSFSFAHNKKLDRFPSKFWAAPSLVVGGLAPTMPLFKQVFQNFGGHPFTTYVLNKEHGKVAQAIHIKDSVVLRARDGRWVVCVKADLAGEVDALLRGTPHEKWAQKPGTVELATGEWQKVGRIRKLGAYLTRSE